MVCVLVLSLTACEGEDGMDGNANVVSVSFNAYSIQNGDNIFDVPELTQEIYEHGVVLGYATVDGNDFWETLPVVSGSQVILDIESIEVGKIILSADFTQVLNIRFVLIEGNDVNAVDFSNYLEVQDYYNLDD